LLDVRPVLFINGFLLLILAAAMGLPAVVDALSEDLDWEVFAAAAGATAFLGGAMMLGAKPDARFRLDIRQAFLVTVTGWLLSALCAALPFAFSVLSLSPTDSLFEAMSGLTTTGATVIVGLDHAPKGILIWRALLNWVGGAGIIVMAVAILPVLRIGGMQIFRMEAGDKAEKIRPRVSQLTLSIATLYVSLTLLSGIGFWLAGMNGFDAVCHAMAALSTGGFSTSDSSLAHWGGGVQWVAVASMLVAGAPFPLMVAPWRRGRAPLVDDTQVLAYLKLLTMAAATLGVWRWATSDQDLLDSLRAATFAVTSIATTTGFVAADTAPWGGFAHVVLFMLAFAGGCSGSPAGGVKIFRWQVLKQLATVHIKRLLHPHGVFVIEFNRRRVAATAVDAVLGFVVLYMVTFAIHALALTAADCDLVTALSGSAAALGNVGRGLGGVIGDTGTWKPLTDPAKWIVTGEMLLGRLELFTVFVVFTSGFWRD